ncbi:DASS family sodium-coupled anion symporter [Halobacteriovorax sp. HLS]|uniref:SLC13 family permease n=1 Tax=Halobacteriovorax sp. HLS TaxID=2234000 RepID=UPI000FDB76AE|nr:DASS family sodium-coupled anion symporter [Halobacteriovorax sp. HLS]
MVRVSIKKLLLYINKWGLVIGPIIFFIILNLNLEMDAKAQTFLAIFSLTVCQWFLTPIPLFVTGLLGVSTSVILGVVPATEAFAPFSNPIIFLFLGGFLFAKALEVMRFDRKISVWLLTSSFFRGSLKRTILGIFSLTAIFSMWVSNTATTAMMLPIVLGMIKSLKIESKELKSTILLGMAYSATIGGLGTPIGSPPNMIAIGMLKDLANIDFSFFQWFITFIPLVIIFILGISWWVTKKIERTNFDIRNIEIIKSEKFEKLNAQEFFVLSLFGLTVFFWFSPSIFSFILGKEHSLSIFFTQRLDPGVVSIFFASLLFVFPLKDRIKILSLEDAKSVDWPSLVLFGSGLSLGGILFKTGLATMAGDILISNFGNSSNFILLLALITFTIFMTEVASNTAAANILIPIVIASASTVNMSVLALVLAVSTSCNMAFMLPVATPPNAIVYGSGEVKIGTMIKNGFFFNIVAIIFLVVLISIII